MVKIRTLLRRTGTASIDVGRRCTGAVFTHSFCYNGFMLAEVIHDIPMASWIRDAGNSVTTIASCRLHEQGSPHEDGLTMGLLKNGIRDAGIDPELDDQNNDHDSSRGFSAQGVMKSAMSESKPRIDACTTRFPGHDRAQAACFE